MSEDGTRVEGAPAGAWSAEPTDPVSFTARFDRFYSRSARAYAAAVRVGPVWRRWLRHVLPHIHGDSALEVSVGTGWLLSQYAGQVRTVGVDLNAAMLDQTATAAERAGIRVPLIRADVHALPIRDGRFDTVVNTMAFSGYPDGAAAMAELGRVLAPQGRIVMIDVSFPADGNRIGTLLARAWQWGGDIVRDLPTLFGAFGFAVAEQEIGGWGSVHLFVAERRGEGAPSPDPARAAVPARQSDARSRTLSRDHARRVYNRIGRLQDTQSFYEAPAVDDLIANADFEHAHEVVELGPGTGRLAHRLLADLLPADARYTGIELSERMARLATDRVRSFGARAHIECRDAAEWTARRGQVDRVIAAYVFDLVDDETIQVLLTRIARVLDDDGRLCVVSLTEGPTGSARRVSSAWTALWRRWPGLLGGCRPIRLRDRLEAAGWTIEHHRTITAWLLTSEVLVAHPPTTTT